MKINVLSDFRKSLLVALFMIVTPMMAFAQTPPTVKTTYVTNIIPSSYALDDYDDSNSVDAPTFQATVYYNLTDYGSSTATAAGILWSTDSSVTNPTVEDVDDNTVFKSELANPALGERNFTRDELPIHQNIYVRAYATNASGTGYGEVMTLKFEDWTLMLRNNSTYNFFDARTASGGNGTTAPNITTFRTDASLFEKHFLASSGGYNNLPSAYLKLRGKSNYPYLYDNGIFDVSASVLNAQPGNDYFSVRGFSIEGFRLIRCTRSGGSGIKYLEYVSSWYGYDDDAGTRPDNYAHVLCPVASAQHWDTKPTINLAQGNSEFCETGQSSNYSRTAGKYYEYYIIKGHTSNAASGDYTAFTKDNGTPTSGDNNFSALDAYAGFSEEWWLCNADGTPYTGTEVSIAGNQVTYVSYFTTETTLQLHLRTTSSQNSSYSYEDPSYKVITFYPQSGPTSIEADPEYLTFEVGDARTFTYSYESTNTPCPYINVTATSSNTSVATVTSSGDGFLVEGEAEGTAIITITAYEPDGTTVACSTTVEVEVTSSGEVMLEDPTDGTGIVDNVVYLDDREDHSWSYYSDPDQPIHSLNPADVRIVYHGNGKRTMTSGSESNKIAPSLSDFTEQSSGAQVNVGEAQDTYYYIKTLERTDGATAATPEAATGRCEYTTIPNPFQVRPSIPGTFSDTRTVYISGYARSTNCTIRVDFTKPDGDPDYREWTNLSGSSYSPNMTITVKAGTTITLNAKGRYGSYSYTYASITAKYDSSSGGTIATATATSSNYNGTGTTSDPTVVEGSVITPTDYRGFYKWRVKRVMGGTIYDAATNGNPIVKGGTIDAEQTVWFAPNDEDGMRVELEALWAQAYVNSSTYVSNGGDNGTNYKCAYERNFKVGTSLTTYNYPVTISTLNPNGTGTLGSVSMSSNYTCSNDVKLENMTISGGSSRVLNGNAYNLTIGRGVSGTINRVNGFAESGSTSRNFRLRIEGGQFTKIRFVGNGVTFSGKVTAVLGSDYDRARKYNTYPKVTGTDCEVVLADNSSTISTGTIGGQALDCTVKSGDYDWGGYAGNFQFYISAPSSTIDASRKLVVEGGKFADIAGGIETSTNLQTIGSYAVDGKRPIMVDMRFKGSRFVEGNDTIVKGATVNGALFGAAQYSGSAGDRRMVITGGEFTGWIAGGCNGTKKSGGELFGVTYIYFGGNAKVVQTGANPYTDPTDTRLGGSISGEGTNGAYGGYIFGAGCGIAPVGFDETAASPNWSLLSTNYVGKVFGSRIVIADSCVVGRDIYGGGNFGFVADATAAYNGTNSSASNYHNTFGLGTGNTDMTSKIYVLGGTIHGDVNGGSNNSLGQAVEIYMRGGELVGRDVESPAFSNNSIDGDIYGGSDTWGTVNGTATIEMTNGTVHGNVFGGGYGSHTDMKDDCTVTIKGGTVMHNVYGGGNEGTSGNTGAIAVTVNIMGGKILGDVYGGALGTLGNIHVAGIKTVNIGAGADGTVGNHDCYIGGSVYGGSRRADDCGFSTTKPTGTFPTLANPNSLTWPSGHAATDISSRVNIASGYVQYHVFGSGFFGETYGTTLVYIGQNAILNAPNHETTLTGPTGYDAPNILRVNGNVYGGADYGQFDGTTFGAATIAGYAHIYIDGLGYDTKNSMATAPKYMNLDGSVYGCGTSCYSGLLGSNVYIRNYGYAVSNGAYTDGADMSPYLTATRHLQSVQFADNLVIDNSNIHFPGQGKINSLSTTEKYAVYEIKNMVCVANRSSLFIDYPINQIKALGSYSCADIYASSPEYQKITLSTLDATDNKIRVNNGAAIYVYRSDMLGTDQAGYGELAGFFHLMNDDANVCYLYARPRQSSDAGNTIADTWNNANDGGYVSYYAGKNTYSEGDASSTSTAPGYVGEGGVQIPYENHAPATKGDSQYFRIWQYRTGLRSTRNGVFDAHVASSDPTTHSVAEVVIELPACVSGGKYRIKTDEGYLYVDYGDEVTTFNSAYTEATGRNNVVPAENKWMRFENGSFVLGKSQAEVTTADGLTSIDSVPDLRFGLMMIPDGGLAGGDEALVFNSSASNNALKALVWDNTNPDQNPQMRFLLTYSNGLQANAALAPIIITFEQYTEEDGVETVIDEVEVRLQVVTSTSITQDFKTEVYAIMKGKGEPDDTYSARVTFPTYRPHDLTSGTDNYSEWTLESVSWAPKTMSYGQATQFDANDWKVLEGTPFVGHFDQFAMTCVAALNSDNQLGWERTDFDEYDSKKFDNGGYSNNYVASSFGRNSATIEFTLHYDGSLNAWEGLNPGVLRDTMGILTFHFNVTNCEDAGSANGYVQDVQVDVEIMRVGKGKGWYLDGVNGDNNYSGAFPNQAMSTLGAILSHSDYQPGDEIYIVNEVSTGSNPLDWSGWDYDGITLYRYPGGHALADTTDATFVGNMDYYITSNGDKPNHPVPYTGTLVNVTSDMTMQMITLDGSYGSNGNTVESSAPLVTVADGNTLTLTDNTTLQNNYNSNGNGGGIVMGENATLNMDNGATITDNAVGTGYEGGGVYMSETSTMNVDHLVFVYDNHEGTGSSAPQSNVYLPTYQSVVNCGENPDAGTHIGVTKTEFFDEEMNQLFAYTPVAYSDFKETTEFIMDNHLFTDDSNRFSVEIFDDAHMEYPDHYDNFFGTWFTAVTSDPDYDSSTNTTTFDPTNIHTPEELAWAISLVNGRLETDPGNNTVTAQPGTNFTLTADIDMSDNIWEPIGNSSHPYTGTFNGNGHSITGLQSPLYRDDMGLFGQLGSGAVVENLITQVNFRDGNMTNIGSIAGTNNGGTISNCEAGGTLKGNATTENIGGLVGKTTGGTIHSCFATNDIIAESGTLVGGLVGENGANLYNSYSNVVMTGGNQGGLVGKNKASYTVENCYTTTTTNAFAYENENLGATAADKGHINYCYAPAGTTVFVGKDGSTPPTGHGTYGPVLDRKAIGYMYDDNKVTLESGETNTYVVNEIIYKDRDNNPKYKIVEWPGMLSALNQWVLDNPHGFDPAPTKWFRPTTNLINGDLPVLGFSTNNSMATMNSDGRFLQYDGLDALLTEYANREASIFLYDNATNVANVPLGALKVFINEDACLIQADGAGAFGNTTVGITFDNSCKNAKDYFNHTLAYDWHLMSTPLSDAPIGASYSSKDEADQYKPNSTSYSSDVDISSLYNSYFPNGLTMGANLGDSEVKWDFYSYFEPEYHWINLKRNKKNHFHYEIDRDPGETGVSQEDGDGHLHYQVNYTGTDQADNSANDDKCFFTKGKGYMMAISQDSYMSSTGTLNKGNDTIKLTHTIQDPNWDGYFNQGCNLIGNPYQAYLDLNSISGYSCFFVYSADQDQYVAFHKEQSTNTFTPSRYIHPHQAFFVMLENSTGSDYSENFIFTPSMATTTKQEHSYFRGGHDYPLINLFVSNEEGARNYAIVEVGRPELGGAVRSGALKTTNFDLYAHYGQQDYKLLFTPAEAQRVAVFFKTEEDGQYTLTWDTQNGQFSFLRLIDNITGVEYDMLTHDHYTFEGKATDFAARFYIIFNNPEDDPQDPENADQPFAFNDGYGWIVNGSGQLELVDVLGRVLHSEYLSGEVNRVHFDGFAQGTYLLRLIKDRRNEVTQKIVIY